jgi:hypothetical protein
MLGGFAGYRPATKLDLIFGAKTMKKTKSIFDAHREKLT